MKKTIISVLAALVGFVSIAFASTGSTASQIHPHGEGGTVLKCTEPPNGQQSCPVRIFLPGQPPISATLALGEIIATGANSVVTCNGCTRV